MKTLEEVSASEVSSQVGESMARNQPYRVALLTYNRIGEGQYENGLIEKPGLEIYITQNGHRSKWGASRVDNQDSWDQRVRLSRRIMSENDLGEMDMTYIYVGTSGGIEMIEQSKQLDPKKVTYVMCDCSYDSKKQMIRNLGHSSSRVMMCECGGRDTMEKILKTYLDAEPAKPKRRR